MSRRRKKYDGTFNKKANAFTDAYGQTITHVHSRELCKHRTGCPIHSPSKHAMRKFKLRIRIPGAFDIKPLHIERICPHDVGHPDPDDMLYHTMERGDPSMGVHGCDGCCYPDHHLPTGQDRSVTMKKVKRMEAFTTTKQAYVLADVLEKRDEQSESAIDYPNGDLASLDCDPLLKLSVLTEALGEVAAETLDSENVGPGDVHAVARNERVRSKLIELAALTVAWAESVTDSGT